MNDKMSEDKFIKLAKADLKQSLYFLNKMGY